MRLTGIDVFAGAGGFSLAAQRIGVNIRAAIEIDAHSCATYRKNLVDGRKFPPVVFQQDVATVDWLEVLTRAGLTRGECDILLGGPPCQGFSTHRINNSGVDDPRNLLLLKYFDCIKAVLPRAFIVENVAGLLWERHALYLKKFLTMAKEAGYRIYGPTLLNAKNFGVPQNRKRIFIVGVRLDVPTTPVWPPLPTHFNPNSEEVRSYGLPPWINAKTVFESVLLPKDPNAVHMQSSEALTRVFKSTPLNGGSRKDSGRILPCHKKHDGHKDVYGRINPDQPGPTMTTACINPSKGRFLHPTRNHGICARHAARFQAFPDDYEFCGGLIASGVQIGNAVPILLGERVISPILKCLLPSSKNHRLSSDKAVDGSNLHTLMSESKEQSVGSKDLTEKCSALLL